MDHPHIAVCARGQRDGDEHDVPHLSGEHAGDEDGQDLGHPAEEHPVDGGLLRLLPSGLLLFRDDIFHFCLLAAKSKPFPDKFTVSNRQYNSLIGRLLCLINKLKKIHVVTVILSIQ